MLYIYFFFKWSMLYEDGKKTPSLLVRKEIISYWNYFIFIIFCCLILKSTKPKRKRSNFIWVWKDLNRSLPNKPSLYWIHCLKMQSCTGIRHILIYYKINLTSKLRKDFRSSFSFSFSLSISLSFCLFFSLFNNDFQIKVITFLTLSILLLLLY